MMCSRSSTRAIQRLRQSLEALEKINRDIVPIDQTTIDLLFGRVKPSTEFLRANQLVELVEMINSVPMCDFDEGED